MITSPDALLRVRSTLRDAGRSDLREDQMPRRAWHPGPPRRPRADWEKAQQKERRKQAKKPDAKFRPDWSDEKHGLWAFLEQTELAVG